jgi:hypothetical protein
LREFIQTSLAQELTKGCKTLLIGEKITSYIPLITHGAELVEGKDTTVFAGSGLGEYNWATHTNIDSDRQQQ